MLAPPTIFSATQGAGTVALTWSAVTAPDSGAVSYYVSRDGGAPAGNCPSSTSTSTGTSCIDAGVSVATHTYTVTAVWRSWTAVSTTVQAQVTFGPATHFVLTAASTTPTAGVKDNLTVTAKDQSNITVATYTGSHSLTFGGASSIGAFTPTVSSSSGIVTSFGTATAITFTNGVATVAGANNGAMKLYAKESALVTVTDGSVGNGAGLSVTVASAAAASFTLQAASTTPTAGVADNLTVTAFDAFGNVATSYTGSHNLTFGGATNSPNANKPTVTNSTGVVKNFGVATATTFTNGIATTAGANNGVMTLYNVETASITVVSGAVNNGTGLTATVAPGSPARLAWTHATVSAGTLSATCLFTCTVTTLGNAGTFTANVSVTDSSGNTVSSLGAGHTVTVSTPSSGAGSGGGFTNPTAGTSVNLTIGSAGTADSSAQFTFTAQSGVWTSDTMTAQTLAGTSYTNATATLNK